MRPPTEAELSRLVKLYAGGEKETQIQLFAQSLRAALTVEELRTIVKPLGFDPATVQATSDRHWTWQGRKQ
jgi:hypothetical protein